MACIIKIRFDQVRQLNNGEIFASDNCHEWKLSNPVAIDQLIHELRMAIKGLEELKETFYE